MFLRVRRNEDDRYMNLGLLNHFCPVFSQDHSTRFVRFIDGDFFSYAKHFNIFHFVLYESSAVKGAVLA